MRCMEIAELAGVVASNTLLESARRCVGRCGSRRFIPASVIEGNKLDERAVSAIWIWALFWRNGDIPRSRKRTRRLRPDFELDPHSVEDLRAVHRVMMWWPSSPRCWGANGQCRCVQRGTSSMRGSPAACTSLRQVMWVASSSGLEHGSMAPLLSRAFSTSEPREFHIPF